MNPDVVGPDLLDALGQLGPAAQGQLWAAFAVFLRVGAMLALLPAFGEQTVPVRVRLGLGVAFTLIVLPAVAPDLPPLPARPERALGFLVAEVAAGLVFGIFLRLFVLALQTAGSIAAQATSLAQMFGGGMSAEPSPAMTHLLVTGALALAALLGLHVRLAAYMIQGYQLIPPGAVVEPGLLLEAGVGEVARAFALAFSLSAPFVIAALLYNVTMGVINRAMPALMVSFIGAPALTLGALLLMGAALPLMLSLWSDALLDFMAAPFAGAR